MTETIFVREVLDSFVGRTASGAVLSFAVAGFAWRKRALSKSGFAAAVGCGTLSAAGGWDMALVLAGYFLAAMSVSRFTHSDEMPEVTRIVAKGDRRDAIQVVANGGVYSILAVIALLFDRSWILAGALGALAASSSDSWATAFGTRFGGRPRLITTGATVRRGQSGGVTTAGLAGSLGGALIVAALSSLAGLPRGLALASMVAGLCGSTVDSLLGATVQERRWCDTCGEPTERALHVCGDATRCVGGIQTMDNDVINLISTFAGSVSGVTLYLLIEWVAGRSTIG